MKKKNNPDYINYEQVFFRYDSVGRLFIKHRNSWDAKNNAWINLNRKCIDYFTDGSEKSSLYQDWDSSNQLWVNNKLIENSEGTIELGQSFELEKKWKENEWINDSKIVYNYDKDGNCIDINSYEWDKSKWNLTSKTHRIYTIFNKMVKSYSCEWNDKKKQFENTFMNEYNYSLAGKIISEMEYFWEKQRS